MLAWIVLVALVSSIQGQDLGHCTAEPSIARRFGRIATSALYNRMNGVRQILLEEQEDEISESEDFSGILQFLDKKRLQKNPMYPAIEAGRVPPEISQFSGLTFDLLLEQTILEQLYAIEGPLKYVLDNPELSDLNPEQLREMVERKDGFGAEAGEASEVPSVMWYDFDFLNITDTQQCYRDLRYLYKPLAETLKCIIVTVINNRFNLMCGTLPCPDPIPPSENISRATIQCK